MARRAITLVELIVVVAIFVALAALLLPVFSAARASAKQAASIQYLRQIGMAWSLYGDAYDSVLMIPRAWLGGRKYAYWWASYDEVTGERREEEGLLYPFTRGAGVQADPNWTDRRRQAIGFTGYAYNHRYLGSGRVRLSAIGQPSSTVAFASSARVNFLPPHDLEGNAYLEPPSAAYPTFHARAAGLGVVLWIDGHIRGRRPRLRGDPRYDPHRLGEIDDDGDLATDELFDLE
jgi:type II secretory pathway pseudopilin PulG